MLTTLEPFFEKYVPQYVFTRVQTFSQERRNNLRKSKINLNTDIFIQKTVLHFVNYFYRIFYLMINMNN